MSQGKNLQSSIIFLKRKVMDLVVKLTTCRAMMVAVVNRL